MFWKKVLGSMRQLLHELKIELSGPSNSQVSSMIDVNNLLSLDSSVLSHTCEKASFRCHKKCDKTGQMICRFSLYEPCSETFFKTVDRPHSTEVWDILIELGLATFVEESGSYNVCKPLEAGKYNYAADFGELFSLVTARIFSIVQSSMNCLICDSYVSHIFS